MGRSFERVETTFDGVSLVLVERRVLDYILYTVCMLTGSE